MAMTCLQVGGDDECAAARPGRSNGDGGGLDLDGSTVGDGRGAHAAAVDDVEAMSRHFRRCRAGRTEVPASDARL